MTKDSPDDEKSEATIKRLVEENSQWRRSLEEAKVIIRRRAPKADGLSFKSSIVTILNQRDMAEDNAEFYRNEIKRILKFLLNSEASDKTKIDELKKDINLFLFKNGT